MCEYAQFRRGCVLIIMLTSLKDYPKRTIDLNGLSTNLRFIFRAFDSQLNSKSGQPDASLTLSWSEMSQSVRHAFFFRQHGKRRVEGLKSGGTEKSVKDHDDAAIGTFRRRRMHVIEVKKR